MLIASFVLPGEYTVQLAVNETETVWYVTYGLQEPKTFSEFEPAYREFKLCIEHSAYCGGYLKNGEDA